MDILSKKEVEAIADRHLRIDPSKKPYGLGRHYTLLSFHDGDTVVGTEAVVMNMYRPTDFNRTGKDAFFADLAIESSVPDFYVFIEKIELMALTGETTTGQKITQLVRKQDVEKVTEILAEVHGDVPPPPPPPPPLRLIREGVSVSTHSSKKSKHFPFPRKKD